MFEGPRNWKWMVPAMLALVCLVVWQRAFDAQQSAVSVQPVAFSTQPGAQGEAMGTVAMVSMGLAVIFLVATLLNGWTYISYHWSDVYANIRVAQNSTPEVRMFEAAKGMHPEAVKALLVHRRTIWKIKYVPQRDVVDWILEEAPTVHAGFVDFVLDHSNGVTLMAKHGRLSEGSTKFDPDGIVTDYQQYDDLLFVMKMKLMCTEAFGNQAPHFLPPWNVELLRKRFGLEGGGYQLEAEMSEAMKKVVQEQQLAVSGQPLAKAEQTVTQKPVRTVELELPEDVQPLNEEAMQAEMERYGKQYANGIPSVLAIKNKNS